MSCGKCDCNVFGDSNFPQVFTLLICFASAHSLFKGIEFHPRFQMLGPELLVEERWLFVKEEEHEQMLLDDLHASALHSENAEEFISPSQEARPARLRPR